MHRIFRKKHDLAARATESRARRPRRARPGLESLEGRQLLSLGSEFRVNTGTFATNFDSDNASSANGMHMAVWADDDGFVGGNVILGQLFTAHNFAVGGNFLITFGEGLGGSVTRPSVAMDAHGNSVVVYQETINGQQDIIAKRITLDPNTGLPVLGNAIVVANTVVNGVAKNEHDADVAMDANGNFVVSYTEDFSATDKDIRAVRFTSTGARIGFVSETAQRTNGNDETFSSVAMSPDGRFDIVYQTNPHGGVFNPLVNMARYSSSGVRLSDGPILEGGHSELPIFGTNSDVAMDNAGNAVVVFQTVDHGFGNTNSPLFNIHAIRVKSDGTNNGDRNITTDGNSDPGGNNVLPSVALSPTGGSYVVAWDRLPRPNAPGSHQSVAVAEVNAADATTFVTVLPASPTNFDPAVSINSSGDYLLTYTATNSSGHRDIHERLGNLPAAPAAKDLKLTPTIQAGQSAVLSGQLFDGDGDTNLTLTVNWGDGSQPQRTKPGTKAFALHHKFTQAGTYPVHATWTDSTGLSNSRDLKLVVTPQKKK
jgi:hypothetical protein